MPAGAPARQPWVHITEAPVVDAPRRRLLVAGSALATVLLAGAAGFLGLEAIVIALVCLIGLMLLADRSPVTTTWLAFAVVGLVPAYWGPAIPGTNVLLTPAMAMVPVLLVAWRRVVGRVRPDRIDVAACSTFILGLAATIVSFGVDPVQLAVAAASGGLPVYVAARAASVDPRGRKAAQLAIATTVVILAAVAVAERLTGSNPFIGFGDRSLYSPRTDLLTRFGGVRAEATFGQPVPLSVFLGAGTAVLIVLALRRGSWQWRIAPAVAVAGLLATRSRSGVAAMLVALAIVVVGTTDRRSLQRLLVGTIAAAVLVMVTGAAGDVVTLTDSLSGTSQEAVNVSTRQALFDTIGDPAQLTLLGRSAPAGIENMGELVSSRAPISDVADEYVYLWLSGGLLTTAAFVALAPLGFAEALRRRHSSLDRGWWAAVLGIMVGLIGTTLFTQLQPFFWAMVALGARRPVSTPSRSGAR